MTFLTNRQKICILLNLSFSLAFPGNAPAVSADDPGIAYYEIIEQRNFFRPTKDLPLPPRPAPEDSAENLPPKAETPDLSLTGVIEIKNGYKAIIEKNNSEKGFYVAREEAVEDYTVREIYPDKVVLERAGKTYELRLKQGAKSAAALTSAAEPAPLSRPEDKTETEPELHSNTMQRIRMGIRGNP